MVDCRKKSKTFGKHFKVIISEKNSKSIYIPPGFLHGFLGLEKENTVIYGCTNYRNKNSEIGIKWNDKDLKINWNIKSPILSNKDKKNLEFQKVNFKMQNLKMFCICIHNELLSKVKKIDYIPVGLGNNEFDR